MISLRFKTGLFVTIQMLLLYFVATPVFAVDTNIPFNDTERAWLKAHPVVRVAPDPDFAPVEFFDQKGQYKGIAADFIRLIEQKLPIRFQILHLKNWDECLEKVKSGEADMLSAATPTSERVKFVRFTSAFVKFPAVVITREKMKKRPKVGGLKGLQVAVVRNYAAHEFMKEKHPEVDLVVVPDISTGLRLVSFGRVDAMVLNLGSASYFIEKEGITNLKIYKDTGFIYDLSMAVALNEPILQSILQKTIDAITPDERSAIMKRWVGVKKDFELTREMVIWGAGALTLITLLLVLAWNISLRRLVHCKTWELQKELNERLKAEKEKEELQSQVMRAKKMEAMGLLAGGVAHDLNNILSGIIGYPELILLHMKKDDPMRKHLKAIKESGQRAASIVADLLTIARGTATEKERCNLNEIIMEYLSSAEHLQATSEHPQVRLETRLDPELLPVKCSQIHIKKILMNLINNALEAADPDGNVTVSTENCYLDKPVKGYEKVVAGEYAVISVSDSGQGIPSKDLERIFEPFYSKKVMGRSGTGLGLAVVWNAVQDHLGYINVESELDQGTTFRIYLPVSRGKIITTQHDQSIEGLTGAGEKILVVDDEKVQRDLATSMLHELGYVADSVESGEEALKFVKHNHVDLVILDMIMTPGINGAETYKRLLEIKPGIRALIASGFSATAEVDRALELGASEFIKKPYTIYKMAEAVKKALRSEQK